MGVRCVARPKGEAALTPQGPEAARTHEAARRGGVHEVQERRSAGCGDTWPARPGDATAPPADDPSVAGPARPLRDVLELPMHQATQIEQTPFLREELTDPLVRVGLRQTSS